MYLNPTHDFIKNTANKGFQTFGNYQELTEYITTLVNSDMNFFSSMLPKEKLGNIILTSSQEKDDISRAEKFLDLIRE